MNRKISAVKSLLGTATQLAQKQAMLAAVNTVTLPKIYHAIGKAISRVEKLPSELETHRAKVLELEAAMGSVNTPSEDGPPIADLVKKAARLAKIATQKVAKATIDAGNTVQLQAAYVALGQEAVKRFGDKAVPQGIKHELARAIGEREALLEEIESLQGDSAIGWLRPQRLLLGATLLGAVLAIFLGWRVLGGKPPVGQATGDDLAADGDSSVRMADGRKFVPKPMVDFGEQPTGGSGSANGSRPGGKFPFSWPMFQQMAGPEGPAAKYFRDERGRLQRIETFFKGRLLAAYTEEPGGFRVTFGSDWALAGFLEAARLSREETDQLTDAFSFYITDKTRRGQPSRTQETESFQMRFEPDPHMPGAFKSPSVVFMPL